MANYTYKQILTKAKECQTNVKKQYKTGISSKWSYYFAKEIVSPKKNVTKLTLKDAPNPTGTGISRQIVKKDYIDMCNRLIKFVEKNKTMPNYVSYSSYKIKPVLLTEILSRILVYYANHNAMPNYVNANSKVFTKPSENTNEIYNYFVKKFGKVEYIDDALSKIAGKGYGYYYDDHKSNKETIDSIASSSHNDDPNCTDATQMMKHVGDGTGKYKKIDCIHVKCQGGDGHVYLKITKKDGSVFYRDPAAVLDSGVVTKIWCANGTVLATNPSWWLSNLNR